MYVGASVPLAQVGIEAETGTASAVPFFAVRPLRVPCVLRGWFWVLTTEATEDTERSRRETTPQPN